MTSDKLEGSGACVSRRSNVEMNSAPLHDDNDLSPLFPSAGTTTTSYYDEEVNRKTLHALAPSSINATQSPPLTSRFNKILGNNNSSSLKSNETSDRLIFRSKHLPFRMLDGRPILYSNVRIHPWPSRPLVYHRINQYYYYPRYYVRPDRKKIFLYW